MARKVKAKEIKYFVSNAPPRTALMALMKVVFTRAGVEHVLRLAKSEIGLDHFEGRSWLGLLRHMTLCQPAMLLLAEQTARALNTLGRAWQQRRGGRSGIEQVASVAQYHLARNQAAKDSRLRDVHKRK